MTINFVSSEDPNKIHTMHTKSDNIDILMGSEMDDFIKELFKSLLQRFQEILEESIRGSEFIIDSVNLLEYKLNQINIANVGSCIDSRKWLKNKKATINSKNNDDDCFQYAIIAALNHKQINSHPGRISNLKPFINQYNWREADFPDDDDNDNKQYHKVGDHFHYTGKFRGAAHSIRNLRYKSPKEISILFHNGSTYYQFIINQLAK